MKMDWKILGLGLAAGAAVNIAWSMWPEAGRFRTAVLKATSTTGEPEKSPLAFVEHYHWGLACTAIAPVTKPARDVLVGLGTAFIVAEATGDNPFGMGKTEYEVKGNITLASLLIGANLISWSILK